MMVSQYGSGNPSYFHTYGSHRTVNCQTCGSANVTHNRADCAYSYGYIGQAMLESHRSHCANPAKHDIAPGPFTVFIAVENESDGTKARWRIDHFDSSTDAIEHAEEMCAQEYARTGIEPHRARKTRRLRWPTWT